LDQNKEAIKTQRMVDDLLQTNMYRGVSMTHKWGFLFDVIRNFNNI
jgi:hypothetical protein